VQLPLKRHFDYLLNKRNLKKTKQKQFFFCLQADFRPINTPIMMPTTMKIIQPTTAIII
jgi:hypothetical protein